MAWADVARGVEPDLAAARELAGYYTLLAERDALASLLSSRAPTGADEVATGEGTALAAGPGAPRGQPKRRAEKEPSLPLPPSAPKARAEPPAPAAPSPRSRPPAQRRSGPARPTGRGDQILGLFAYHRDAPQVARALSLSMAELEAEIDGLKLRRKTSRLARGRDVDLPAAASVPGVAHGPPVRRRVRPAATAGTAEGASPPAGQPPQAAAALPLRRDKDEEVAAQAARLREALRQLGPRRDLLAKKLGAPGKPLPLPVLLARFRAAGLEREFGQRERDLLRALLKRNRAALGPVAKELQLDKPALEALIRDRGLAREVEAERAAMREKVRARSAPRDRVDQVLRQRDWLSDLGILDDLDRDLESTVRGLWDRAREAGLRGPAAVDRLRRELGVPAPDVRALLARHKLRA